MKAEPAEYPMFPEIYANLSQVSASPSDISITLGLSGTAPLGDVANDPPKTVALLRLSPPTAKMLMLNLQQMLRVYEQRFAEIYVPKEYAEVMRLGDSQLGLTSDDDKKGAS